MKNDKLYISFKIVNPIIVLTFGICMLYSCKKYLDISPNKQLTTPEVLQDLRAVLDNSRLMNAYYSPYGSIASDDYYISDNNYKAITDPVAQNYYIWGLSGEPDLADDWLYNYKRIFYANVVLDNVDIVKLNGASQSDYEAVKGEAFFYRALTHFQLSQIYSLPFNPVTASNILGVPLRLTSDINAHVIRPTLKEDFSSIISDFQQAIRLLPLKSQTKLRPNRCAAFAALANVFLVMQGFVDAKKMADSALSINDSLIDYNNILPTATTPFSIFNSEVIWQADNGYNTILATTKAKADSNFYKSFGLTDLRRHIYFDNSNGQAAYKGHYNAKWKGSSVYFAGIATDELYLIKAESDARTGNVSMAMATLNILAKNRFKKGDFIPFDITDKDSAIKVILDMRRKELCFRGMIRWMDIRRLNQLSGEQKIIPERNLLGETYRLEPDDVHFAFLIPQNVIDNSKIPQNVR